MRTYNALFRRIWFYVMECFWLRYGIRCCSKLPLTYTSIMQVAVLGSSTCQNATRSFFSFQPFIFLGRPQITGRVRYTWASSRSREFCDIRTLWGSGRGSTPPLTLKTCRTVCGTRCDPLRNYCRNLPGIMLPACTPGFLTGWLVGEISVGKMTGWRNVC